MAQVPIIHLTGALSIDIGADYRAIIPSLFAPEIDLTNVQVIAQIRDYPGASTIRASFTTSIDTNLRELNLVMSWQTTATLKPKSYNWDALVIYPVSDANPDGWREYLCRGDVVTIPRVSVPSL